MGEPLDRFSTTNELIGPRHGDYFPAMSRIFGTTAGVPTKYKHHLKLQIL